MNYRNLVIGILIFFSPFLSNLGLIANAQYDEFGGYDYYYEDSYDYQDIYYDYSYDYYDYDHDYYIADTYVAYDTYNYPYYTYPSLSYPSVGSYPVAPYTNYNYPPIPTPGVNNYPVVPYTDYVYPPVPTPGVNDYPVASYGNYSYPPVPYPAVTNYPISFGGYQNITTPQALAATSETVAHAQSVSEVPTGPDGMLPWIFIGGLALSILAYLIFLGFRLKMTFKIFGNGSNTTILERRLEEIRNSELKPDTNDFQF